MLDTARLRTPTGDGEVLVEPAASTWRKLLHANHQALTRTAAPLLEQPLSYWRRRTREHMGFDADAPLVVIGHQPDFFHPGVWAKHVAAMRLAQAVGGRAVNLVCDHDAPRSTILRVPEVTGEEVKVRGVRYANVPGGRAFECFPGQSPQEVDAWGQSVREAMQERYDDSLMPRFLKVLRGASGEGGDWVDQFLTAQRAIEAGFDVAVEDVRVRDAWLGPLLLDMMLHAERFAAAYNGALAAYRRRHRIRGAGRPIPDLSRRDERRELPAWVYRVDQGRRRLFVQARGGDLHLWAEAEAIGVIPAAGRDAETSAAEWTGCFPGWCIRPRALTLTMWARMLLADLFIHGIGGAKYDRISDAIMGDYYGIDPPGMACVTATLRLDLARWFDDTVSPAALRMELRDRHWNPQRYAPASPALGPLLRRHDEAVKRAESLKQTEPGNRFARREAFLALRAALAALREARPEVAAEGIRALRAAEERWGSRVAARDREYFFGLFDPAALRRLLAALPAADDFRV